MKEEVRNLLEKYVKVKEIKVDEDEVCIAYMEKTKLSSSFFNELKDYHYTLWYCRVMECMAIAMLKK